MKLITFVVGVMGVLALSGCAGNKSAAGDATPPRLPIGSTTGGDVKNGTPPAVTDPQTGNLTTPTR